MLLRELRRRAGLTQEELARSARVGVRTLRDLETGRASRPQRSTVDLLASALGLDAAARDAFLAAARGRSADIAPRATAGLIGRDPMIAEIGALLDAADLVTLVGLGGVGKTALATAVSRRVMDAFPGGTGAVTVAEAMTGADVLREAGVDALAARLAVGRVLILIDGADRSAAAAIAAVERLREFVPAPRLLVTSRHSLGLPQEYECPVPPLEVPPASVAASEVFAYPAAALLVERLSRVRRRPVGPDHAPTVAALVRRLDGLPVALELAATRGRVLELDEILARCLRPTRAAAHDEPAVESVRASVRSNWLRLSPPERACLGLLAALPPLWSMALAEKAVAGQAIQRAGGDVAALVDRLVGLGLVTVRSDDLRFSMLEAVRELALEHVRP